jgi:hypothetical protein
VHPPVKWRTETVGGMQKNIKGFFIFFAHLLPHHFPRRTQGYFH